MSKSEQCRYVARFASMCVSHVQRSAVCETISQNKQVHGNHILDISFEVSDSFRNNQQFLIAQSFHDLGIAISITRRIDSSI